MLTFNLQCLNLLDLDTIYCGCAYRQSKSLIQLQLRLRIRCSVRIRFLDIRSDPDPVSKYGRIRSGHQGLNPFRLKFSYSIY